MISSDVQYLENPSSIKHTRFFRRVCHKKKRNPVTNPEKWFSHARGKYKMGSLRLTSTEFD